MIVRAESPADVTAVRQLLVDAFSDMEHSQQTEHLIVDALRESGTLSLSLVAEVDGRVVGYVAFSPATIGDDAEGWYVLGPIAVAREARGRGVARALVESGVESLRATGARGVVLVGDPALYGRFGFARDSSVVWPGIPGEYVQLLLLSDDSPQGEIGCEEAFSIEPDGKG